MKKFHRKMIHLKARTLERVVREVKIARSRVAEEPEHRRKMAENNRNFQNVRARAMSLRDGRKAILLGRIDPDRRAYLITVSNSYLKTYGNSYYVKVQLSIRLDLFLY